jgi:branched-chain amino acid transport system substrate-binding protein
MVLSIGLAAAAMSFALAGPGGAQVKILLDFALTGPTAAIIIPHDKAWKAFPKTIGGEPATFQVVDDHGDPTEAVKLVERAISEDHVDAIVMSGTIPICNAVSQLALDNKTPAICTSPAGATEPRFHWLFTVAPQTMVLMKPAVDSMKAKGAKSIAYIGFSDSFGDIHLDALRRLAEAVGIKVATDTRFDRTATSLTGQALKVLAGNPDAVFVGASGTPAALAQKTLVDLGYKGPIYLTNAVFSSDFVRVGGKSVEGGIALATPFFLVDQLPDSNPNKPAALELQKLWQSKYGNDDPGTGAGFAYDAYLMLGRAIPVALQKGKPGTPEFRMALRDAIEGIKDLVGSSGTYTMSPTDHNGTSTQGVLLAKLQDGKWVYVP